MNIADRYGWTTAKPTCAFAFLAPCVLKILRRLGASSVLDVGCGNGALCGTLKEEGFNVVGVEYDQEGCEIARRTYPGIRFYNIGVYDSPEQIMKDYPEGFDCVVSTEVVEHLFSPRFLPIFAARAVRASRGHLIISTPYHGFLKNLLLSLFNHWDVHLSPLWEGGHVKLWSKKTLTQLLEKNGFEVVEFHGVGRFPFLWKSMILVAKAKG